MSRNTTEHARRRYAMEHWSEGYFDVDDQGELIVFPQGRDGGPAARITDLLLQCRERGLNTPLLMRFTDILEHRARTLTAAFDQARADQAYDGEYKLIYPIKVNQQRSVVERLTQLAPDGIGLEAGSKAELLILLGTAPKGTTVVCNGFKDRQYIRLALLGQAMGFDVNIVIESVADAELIIRESTGIELRPALGLRVRLSSTAKGKWQNTGGERSKFGLSAGELIKAGDALRAAGLASQVRLLHVHMGSQISHIRDLQQGMREIARYFASLRGMGLPLGIVDVGGGLAVDYEGTRSRSDCSANYELADYARVVVRALAEECATSDLPTPDIYTESGRALTAHHAVLVTDIVRSEKREQAETLPVADEGDDLAVKDLCEVLGNLHAPPPHEVYHEAADMLALAQDKFVHGLIPMSQLGKAELIFNTICKELLGTLSPNTTALHDLAEKLQGKLADKVLCNMSVFRSLPDVWALNQVFPIVPVSGNNNDTTVNATLGDLTCDSDGRIDFYVGQNGTMPFLEIPECDGERPSHLTFFLVGAYQEILGDIHNLFGAPDSASFSIIDGNPVLTVQDSGELVSEVHRKAGFDTLAIKQRILGFGLMSEHGELLADIERIEDETSYLKSES